MKQAQSMQKKVAEMQEKVEKMEISGVSGGGLVTVVMNGKGEAKSVKIDKSLIVADDVEILEDLLVAAINDAKAKIDDKMNAEMSGLGGLPPGFKLPF